MAQLTPTYLYMNTIGPLREDYIDITTGSTDDWIETRLTNVIHASGLNRSGGTDQNFQIVPNASTGTVDTDMGAVRIQDISGGAIVRIRAVGY